MKKILLKYNELSDEQLMDLFQQNLDSQVFEIVYQRYYKQLIKFIYWLGKDLPLSEDITQSVFEKMFRNPGQFDVQKNFKAWLFTIAKNRWINEVRNNQTRSGYQNRIGDLTLPAVEFPESERIKVDMIWNALNTLSDKHKDTFILKYSNNLTIQEIAEYHDCSPGTVKSRLFYTMKHIREKIDHKLIMEL